MEDPPVVIFVPFLSAGVGASDYFRSGRCGEGGRVLGSVRKNSRSLTAAWSEDGNPACQPDEDPPAAILAPLVSRAAVESNLHCGRRRYEQSGGLLYGKRGGLVGPRRSNHPADRPVAPNDFTETTPAVISIAAREGVGEVAADDDLGGGSRAACGLPRGRWLGFAPLHPPHCPRGRRRARAITTPFRCSRIPCSGRSSCNPGHRACACSGGRSRG